MFCDVRYPSMKCPDGMMTLTDFKTPGQMTNRPDYIKLLGGNVGLLSNAVSINFDAFELDLNTDDHSLYMLAMYLVRNGIVKNEMPIDLVSLENFIFVIEGMYHDEVSECGRHDY